MSTERDGMTPRARVVGMLFLSALPLVGGLVFGWQQHRALTTYLPVEATVIWKEIRKRPADKGYDYQPIVAYEYWVNGRRYQSENLLPPIAAHEVNSNREWAQSVLDEYEVGGKYTAYYDPGDPNSAFLRRRYSFMPGVLLLIFGILQACFPLVLKGKSRARAFPIAMVIWLLTGLLVLGHYLALARPHYSLAVLVSIAVYEFLGGFIFVGVKPGWIAETREQEAAGAAPAASAAPAAPMPAAPAEPKVPLVLRVVRVVCGVIFGLALVTLFFLDLWDARTPARERLGFGILMLDIAVFLAAGGAIEIYVREKYALARRAYFAVLQRGPAKTFQETLERLARPPGPLIVWLRITLFFAAAAFFVLWAMYHLFPMPG